MLENWSQDTIVSNDTVVIRLKKISKLHFSDDHKRPPDDLFRPSSQDELQGRERKKQPLVSVWDDKTPKEEYPRVRKLPTEDLLVIFKTTVRDLHALDRHNDYPPVEVHKDPLEEEISVGHLHYGIQGFYNNSSSKEAKLFFKNLRAKANDKCLFDGVVS